MKRKRNSRGRFVKASRTASKRKRLNTRRKPSKKRERLRAKQRSRGRVKRKSKFNRAMPRPKQTVIDVKTGKSYQVPASRKPCSRCGRVHVWVESCNMTQEETRALMRRMIEIGQLDTRDPGILDFVGLTEEDAERYDRLAYERNARQIGVKL